MVERSNQLTFWSVAPAGRVTVSDDWPIPRSTASNLIRRDDITVSSESWNSSPDIVLMVHSAGWTKEKSKSNQILLNADAASIAALIRIAFAQRETLSLDRLSGREQAVSQLIIRDIGSRRARLHAKSLATSFMRVSQEVFRHDLVHAWLRAVSRDPHSTYEIEDLTNVTEKPDHFIPNRALIEMVRDGLRSHSENYSRLVEPKFIPEGLALLRDEDIRNFIAVRLWQLMLSLADHAAAEGKDKFQIGNRAGFLERIDHLILDRIPVSPKNVTPFLNVLYEEYKHFAEWGQTLPGRGKLWSNEHGLFCSLDKTTIELARSDEPSDQRAEVRFE